MDSSDFFTNDEVPLPLRTVNEIHLLVLIAVQMIFNRYRCNSVSESIGGLQKNAYIVPLGREHNTRRVELVPHSWVRSEQSEIWRFSIEIEVEF